MNKTQKKKIITNFIFNYTKASSKTYRNRLHWGDSSRDLFITHSKIMVGDGSAIVLLTNPAMCRRNSHKDRRTLRSRRSFFFFDAQQTLR